MEAEPHIPAHTSQRLIFLSNKQTDQSITSEYQQVHDHVELGLQLARHTSKSLITQTWGQVIHLCLYLIQQNTP